jgi:Tfp pilus assembly protein PilV
MFRGGGRWSWRERNGIRHRGEAGFTLVEVLIAGLLAVLAVGVVTQTIIMGRRSAWLAQRQLEALHAARATLEDIGRLDFNHAALSAGRHVVPGGFYDVSLADQRTKDITVRTSWLGTAGRTNWVALTTSMSAALHP